MPEKQKTHSWTKAQTTIATSAMLGLMALFNVIASLDRHKVNENPHPAVQPTPTAMVEKERILDTFLTPVSPQSVTRTRSS